MDQISPEVIKHVVGHRPVASNALADTSDWICLKGAAGVKITVIEYTGGGDTDLVLSVHEGATGSGTTALTTGAEFPIWVNTDCATSDAMVRQANGVGYTIDATPGTNQMVVFMVPASVLSAGCKWVQLGSTGGNAGNLVCVFYELYGVRYQQDSIPSAIS